MGATGRPAVLRRLMRRSRMRCTSTPAVIVGAEAASASRQLPLVRTPPKPRPSVA